MAEGGIAAAMGNVYAEDNWKVHFRDTMRGGKLLNHWRMAELHAKEAPERVWELEQWGALFDRTPEGLISQRGLRRPPLRPPGPRRRPHRPGDDPHPAAADGAARHRRLHGVHGHQPAEGRRPHLRRLRLLAGVRPVHRLRRPGRRPGHRRHRQVLEGHLELLGVHRRRPRPGPAGRGHPGQHGVRPVPPDRAWSGPRRCGASWSPSRCAATAASCATPTASASCSTTSRSSSKPRRPTPRPKADRWYTDKRNNRRPPELLPRDEVARAINNEIKAGRGSPHGGVFLDIASRRSRRVHPASGCRRCTTSSRSWPRSTSPRSRWRSARPATT